MGLASNQAEVKQWNTNDTLGAGDIHGQVGNSVGIDAKLLGLNPSVKLSSSLDRSGERYSPHGRFSLGCWLEMRPEVREINPPGINQE